MTLPDRRCSALNARPAIAVAAAIPATVPTRADVLAGTRAATALVSSEAIVGMTCQTPNAVLLTRIVDARE